MSEDAAAAAAEATVPSNPALATEFHRLKAISPSIWQPQVLLNQIKTGHTHHRKCQTINECTNNQIIREDTEKLKIEKGMFLNAST